MTAKKFFETLKLLDALDTQLGLQASLDAIRASLHSLASSPAQPDQQNALATALATFAAAVEKMNLAISPYQRTTIAEMGGTDFYDPLIAEKVKQSVQTNAMTPAVARDFVQNLTTKRAAFLATIRKTTQGMDELGFTDAALKPGAADLAFLIPRDLFDNHLAEFAKELRFVSQLIQDFSEAITGQAQPVNLEGLSSSVPTVAICAGVGVIASIATVVNKFLEAWEKILRIRKMRAELSEMGLKGAAVDELTERITTTVDEVVEESTEIVLIKYPGEAGRKNELENALRQNIRRLFGQIERGLTIEFHAEPKTDAKPDEKAALETIVDVSRKVQFPIVANEPMLLTSAEILEGEIEGIKAHKRTTSHRTTTTETEPRKKPKPE